MNKFKLIAILLFSIVFFACNNNPTENKTSTNNSATLTSENDSTIVIAEINEGVISFVADSSILRNDWQKFINKQSNLGPCVLNRIEITSNQIKNKYYLLVSGILNKKTIKSTMTLKQGKLNCLILSGTTIQCTTTDCSKELEGCVPDSLRCTPCGDKSDCTKIISSSPIPIFPSIAPSVCEN